MSATHPIADVVKYTNFAIIIQLKCIIVEYKPIVGYIITHFSEEHLDVTEHVIYAPKRKLWEMLINHQASG